MVYQNGWTYLVQPRKPFYYLYPMENTDICSTLLDILNHIPKSGPEALPELEKQQERYSELLAQNVEENVAMKKYVPLCYDIGLNIKRANGEPNAKKQQFWLEKAIDDFRTEVKALRVDMNCPVSFHLNLEK